MGKNNVQTFPWQVLFDWYETNGRHHLPWRAYSNTENEKGLLLYRIWLSEILLQQTQVDRVIPYFKKIQESYPTISHLAGASYEEFFPYYQGMGYYSRARNILKTAKIIHETYNGIFPEEKVLLESLPGIGSYTAHALLAFGYGKIYLAWDTNLEKVFARYFHGRKDEKLTKEEKREIEDDFSHYILTSSSEAEQKQKIRGINNALMDFAATIDRKTPDLIDWENYPIRQGAWYETRGIQEPQEKKKSITFPTPDASIFLILHKDHRLYYSEKNCEYFTPFLLEPCLTQDTRKYVQDLFRQKYMIELSVRPIHKKWLSKEGKPYVAIHVQGQSGNMDQFEKFEKKDAKIYIENIYTL